MKKYLLLFTGLFFCVFAEAQISTYKLNNLSNEKVSIKDLQGEYTVVDFWATWCKPCVSAIPKLNTIYQEFAADGVKLIGVNVDSPRNSSKVKPMVKSLGVTYPVLLDPDQELVEEYNVVVFPTLIILNKKGKQVFVHEGFNPGDEELIKAEITNLIKDN